MRPTFEPVSFSVALATKIVTCWRRNPEPVTFSVALATTFVTSSRGRAA